MTAATKLVKVLTIELEPGERMLTASDLRDILGWVAGHWPHSQVEAMPGGSLRIYGRFPQ